MFLFDRRDSGEKIFPMKSTVIGAGKSGCDGLYFCSILEARSVEYAYFRRIFRVFIDDGTSVYRIGAPFPEQPVNGGETCARRSNHIDILTPGKASASLM